MVMAVVTIMICAKVKSRKFLGRLPSSKVLNRKTKIDREAKLKKQVRSLRLSVIAIVIIIIIIVIMMMMTIIII